MSIIVEGSIEFHFYSVTAILSRKEHILYAYTASRQLIPGYKSFRCFALSVWTSIFSLFTPLGLLLCILGVRFEIAVTLNFMPLCFFVPFTCKEQIQEPAVGFCENMPDKARLCAASK